MVVQPGYKRTEVGVIPQDWAQFALQQVCDRISVGLATSVTKHYRPSGVPIVRNLNIKDGFFDARDMLYVSAVFAKANATKSAKALDILTVHTGANIGDTCVLPAIYNNCQTFTTLITTPKAGVLDHYFLCQVMSSSGGKKEMSRLVVGGGKSNLNTGDLKQYRIAIPPLPEQRAIATALSDVDTLIAKLDELITKKRNLKQAAMQQLLTGKKRLPGFDGDWKPYTIEEMEKEKLLRLYRGKVISKKDIERAQGGFPIYSSSVKNDGVFGHYGEFMFNEELITWSIDGGGDFFYRPKHKYSVTNVCGYIRLEPKEINYRFLAAQLQLLHGNKRFDYTSKAHPSVIRKAYLVKIPFLPEQTAIAAVLSDMDAEIGELETRLAKTRLVKQGMMQELLTGKTRLIGA